jgi:hypothetical protein
MKRSASVSLPAIDCVRRTNRILVGEFHAVLDGQVDADDPGDEIVWPIEFLALLLSSERK